MERSRIRHYGISHPWVDVVVIIMNRQTRCVAACWPSLSPLQSRRVAGVAEIKTSVVTIKRSFANIYVSPTNSLFQYL